MCIIFHSGNLCNGLCLYDRIQEALGIRSGKTACSYWFRGSSLSPKSASLKFFLG